MIRQFLNNTFLLLLLVSSLGLPMIAKADIYIATQSSDEINITSFPQANGNFIALKEPAEQKSFSQSSVPNEIEALPYHREVLIASAETSIDPALIHAVMTVESRHNAQAISKKGAYGLMQLMPATAERFHLSRSNPFENIMAGAKYLRELKDLYQGDLPLMLAAYNAGPKAIEKYHRKIPPYLETQLYVPKVLKLYQRYSTPKF